jgi:hypothetical protein
MEPLNEIHSLEPQRQESQQKNYTIYFLKTLVHLLLTVFRLSITRGLPHMGAHLKEVLNAFVSYSDII